MAPTTTLVRSANEKEKKSNGWEELLPLLHPAVADAPREGQAGWAKLSRPVVIYLARTVAKFPWLNHLALAGLIFTDSGRAQPSPPLVGLHQFLRWAIPEHAVNVASLEPAEALVTYFGDPPQARGDQALRSYTVLQLHAQSYLKLLSPTQRKELEPFLLPILVNTPQLIKLSRYIFKKGRAKRKEQAFAVVKDLPNLMIMGRRRYKWLADLDAQVQQVAELVKAGQATLPAVIECTDLDHRKLLFRVWDRESWLQAHRLSYHPQTLDQKLLIGRLFLQLVGPLPETPWFLRAVELRAFSFYPSVQAQNYLRRHRVCRFQPVEGLVATDRSASLFLTKAQRAAAGTLEDSRILFCIEPFLAAAALGLLVLVCFTQSGMRLGEFQQVSGDQECMKIGVFPKFTEATGTFSGSPNKLLFWRLYPKGSTERQPYPVTPAMQEALKVWMETHHRFQGEFIEVAPHPVHFTHVRRFPGRHKFLLQWGGKHLSARVIEHGLDFLLLEHRCLDSTGQPTRITTHVLRHGLAGYLRKQGVPLEEIAGLLKQINVMVTEYYSRLSPEDLHAKLAPFLTRLGDIAEIDPATLRTAGDILNLEQEALKRYGLLRHTPGGTCSTFVPCEVQYKCASCPHYLPDPARRDEVKEKIASHTQAVQLFGELGDYLQADVQKAHRRNWERVEKEMEALAAIELTSPPFESVLKEFGLDNPEEATGEWLLTLKPLPPLPEGEEKAHA